MQRRATNRTTKKGKDWKPGFLAELAKHGNVTEAAKMCAIDRCTAYDVRSRDAAFAKAWDDACEESVDLLEQEARRRAVEGVPEPVFWQGEQVATVQKFSDTLLIFLMKGNRPKKYREQRSLDVGLKPEDFERIVGALAADVRKYVKDPATLKAIQDAWASRTES